MNLPDRLNESISGISGISGISRISRILLETTQREIEKLADIVTSIPLSDWTD